jgi:hypothetical protein
MHNIGLQFTNFTAGYITQRDRPRAACGKRTGQPCDRGRKGLDKGRNKTRKIKLRRAEKWKK